MIRWKLWHVKRHDTWKLTENTENTERSERTLQIKAHVSALMRVQRTELTWLKWCQQCQHEKWITVSVVSAETPRLKRLQSSARRVSAALRPETRRTRSSPWRQCSLGNVQEICPVERWNGDQWRQSATCHQMCHGPLPKPCLNDSNDSAVATSPLELSLK